MAIQEKIFVIHLFWKIPILLYKIIENRDCKKILVRFKKIVLSVYNWAPTRILKKNFPTSKFNVPGLNLGKQLTFIIAVRGKDLKYINE